MCFNLFYSLETYFEISDSDYLWQMSSRTKLRVVSHSSFIGSKFCIKIWNSNGEPISLKHSLKQWYHLQLLVQENFHDLKKAIWCSLPLIIHRNFLTANGLPFLSNPISFHLLSARTVGLSLEVKESEIHLSSYQTPNFCHWSRPGFLVCNFE